jgi:hypothetical protein
MTLVAAPKSTAVRNVSAPNGAAHTTNGTASKSQKLGKEKARAPKPAAQGIGPGELWGRSMSYLRPYLGSVLIVLVAIVIEMAFASVFPLSIMTLIDNAVAVRDDRVLMTTLGGLTVFFLIASAAGVARDR